ncbi:MAG TPA: hypothetical protein VM621_07955 [Luteibacter sp.]|uniref:hypothetical protein n=1 Tax=Luteibacter sp. TaxID=1886636 RepID=UPI002BF11B35|nr:hypothetical protein [Luteibacter sp.]HVI54969.1 hypothetical protein [Luteibacter sp.]
MAEREFPGFTLRSSATKDGSRFKALLSSHPAGRGFPSYFTVYDNRSFRDEASAAAAAEKALGLVLGVEDDGAPIFAEGETGFDDDLPGDETPDEDVEDHDRDDDDEDDEDDHERR